MCIVHSDARNAVIIGNYSVSEFAIEKNLSSRDSYSQLQAGCFCGKKTFAVFSELQFH